MTCTAKIQTNGEMETDQLFDHSCILEEKHDVHECDCDLRWKVITNPEGTPAWLSQALNEGDGVYRP